MDYAALTSAIEDYTDNTEATFVANIPLFIRNTEERILKSIQLDLFRRNASATMSKGGQYLSSPTDFLAPFSLSFNVNGEKVFVEFKDVSFCQSFAPDPSIEGVPQYYAQFDVNNMVLAPTPNANYDCELHNMYRPPRITAGATTGTTWLSNNAELALLYGSLVEAYIFMKGEQDVMAMYNDKFAEAMVGLRMLGEAKEPTQDYRVGRVVRAKQ